MARNRNKGATKRAYLKRWSSASVQCPQSVNNYRVQESEIFQVRKRANGTYINGVSTAVHSIPITKGVSPRRQAVEERIRELLQGVPEYRHIVLHATPTKKIKLFFNSEMIFFFLREEETTIETSITYRSREKAMDVFKQNKIIWVETRTV